MKRMLVSAIALVGLFVAFYLTLYKMGYIVQLTCSIDGCERVNSSKWATFLGLPVAVWGMGFYLVTFVIAYMGTLRRWARDSRISTVLLLLTGFGVLYSAWLTYLELYVIHAICQYCVVSAILVTVMFVISLLDWRDSRKWNSHQEI